MSHITDKRIFDNAYNDWLNYQRNTNDIGQDHRSKIFYLDELIEHEEATNRRKIHYSIISESRQLWKEICIYKQPNLRNFRYVVFMSVYCNYLIREPDPSRENYNEIQSDLNGYYLRPDYDKILRWWIEREKQIKKRKYNYYPPSFYILNKCSNYLTVDKVLEIYRSIGNELQYPDR